MPAPTSFRTPLDPLPRRDFLWDVGGGFAGLALSGLLQQEGLLAADATRADGLAPVAGLGGRSDMPNFAPRAKRVVQLFMGGAASQDRKSVV